MTVYAAERDAKRAPTHPGFLLADTVIPSTGKSKAEIARLLVDPVLADHDFTSGPTIVLLNGMGGTPLIELYLTYNEVAARLKAACVEVGRCLVGNYITSLEMAGASLTLLAADEEMLRLWDAPVSTPGLRWGA